MKHKTAIAAAASIVGVVIAATAAMGANFEILNTSSDSVGDLSAALPAGAVTTTTIVAAPPAQAAEAPPIAGELFAYQIDGVGVVTLIKTGDLLEVSSVDIDANWTWSTVESPGSVELQLVSGGRTVQFSAAVVDGQVVVDVIETTPGVPYDDEYEEEEHEEEDDDEDDDDEDEEHDDD